ncbi:hypothetical protein M9Y10_000058 [Tritrichomonas musculus]|uniref:HNH nuclease domain-containing protein n=1 Tax=Tritrichomonas musculus TaxID=1915356 RepID=A0ABR2L6F0_9EUKA
MDQKINHYEIKESINVHGYVQVNLKSKVLRKHRIIAKQFIPNDDPDHKIEVDHINKDRSDYHLENLRWVTPRENDKNKSKVNNVEYEFVSDLPNDLIKITFYESRSNHFEFSDGQYYYDNEEDEFYTKITDKLYKKMYQCIDKNNKKHIYLYDIDNKKVNVYIEKFKYLYDL